MVHHPRRLMAIGLLAMPFVGHTAVNDIFPTDFVALPAGMANVTVYGASQQSEGPYRNGRLQIPGEANLNLVAMRIAKQFAVGPEGKYAAAPVAVLSYGDISPDRRLTSAMGSGASGMGDLRLGGAFWFHVDRTNREYGAVAMSVSLPTGTYDSSRSFNAGENRFKYVLSAGWLQQLGKRWVMDISPEIAFYGDNDDYRGNRRLSQSVSYALTGYLRYRLDPKLHLMGGAQINRGGATRLDGVPLSGAPDNTRLYAGIVLLSGQNSNLQLRYARDVSIENGFRSTGDMTLRYAISFD